MIKKILSKTILIACFHLMLSGAHAQQGTSSLTGRVLQEETGSYLEGAAVSLSPSGGNTLTNRDGSFAYHDLPAGTYKLEVSYPGLDFQTRTLTLVAEESQNVEIQLKAEVYMLDSVVVTGEREGNAAALVTQKNAMNVVNSVAVDAFGPISDGNLATFLQFLPGVDDGGSLTNGEASSFSVRGMDQSFSTVTMDGNSLGAANAAGFYGDRSFPIDTIPAELIESVMLTKSPTPNMRADSIGGNVDLKTKSALVLKGSRIDYRVAANHNTYRGGSAWRPTAAFTYITQLGKDKSWGLTVAGSYSETFNTQDRVEQLYRFLEDMPTEVENIKLKRLRLLSGEFTRARTGGSVKLEKRLGDLTLYGSVVYTFFDYELDRHDPQFQVRNHKTSYFRNMTDTSLEWSRGATSYSGNFQNTASHSDKETKLWVFSTGGEYKLKRGWIRFDLAHSDSKSDYQINHMRIGKTTTAYNMEFDWGAGNRSRPVLTYKGGNIGGVFAGETDYSTFNNFTYSENPQNITDKTSDIKIDWKQDYVDKGLLKYTQVGASYREKDYRRGNYIHTYNYINDRTNTIKNYLKGTSEPLFNGYYPAFDYFDVKRFGDAFHADMRKDVRTDFSLRSETDYPDTLYDEDVTALYMMAGARTGKLSALFGVRMERTGAYGRGYEFGSIRDPSDPTGSTIIEIPMTIIDRSTDYTDFFPGIHLKYEATRNLILRASWSQSMARPSISQLVPINEYGTDIDEDSGEMKNVAKVNNRNLKPMYSNNYDLSFEYYLPKSGIVSVGVFMRDMKNFISNARGRPEAFGLSGEISNGITWEMIDEVRTAVNAQKAKVRGVELAYVQDLTFLPSFLRRVKFNSNLTLQKTSGSFGDDNSELPNFKDFILNLGLTIPIKKFQIKVSYNYYDSYLSSYSTELDYKEYNTGRHMLNANLQYQFNSRYVIYVDFENILNEAPSTYVVNEDYTKIFEKNGMRMSVGIRGRF